MNNYNKKNRAVLFYSGGKDSTLCFYLLKKQGFEIVLLTAIKESHEVYLHCFNSTLLKALSLSLGSSLQTVTMPKNNINNLKNPIQKKLMEYKNNGFNYMASGDIFLEDEKQFKEKLAIPGMKNIFPLWGMDSEEVAKAFLEAGFKAIIACVNIDILSKTWVGKPYDMNFLRHLKKNKIDICGENGEFHTLVYNGPCFNQEIKLYFDVNNPTIYYEPDEGNFFLYKIIACE